MSLLNKYSLEQWCQKYPLLPDLMRYKEVTWFNPKIEPYDVALKKIRLNQVDVDDAALRLERYRPFIAIAFPETKSANGLIESPLRPIPSMQHVLSHHTGRQLTGRLLLKCDNLLPISGSIKARGGIYEVLKYAERLALENKILQKEEDYSILAGVRPRNFFSDYHITVGSTGNLGLSVGVIGVKFGFRVTVYMSTDARQWKKDVLTELGVEVIAHNSDYSEAVAAARKHSEMDSRCHFIDDENSTDLFLGYAVAARRLQAQLNEMGIQVNDQQPLFVYLPCGVGGSPGGISFGLKLIFGDNVRCFFSEPTHSPSMLFGLYTGLHDKVSVQDFGINNKTDADGLAVGRPSAFVGKMMSPLIDGVLTIEDNELYRILALLSDSEDIRLEPSALAGMPGMARILSSPDYVRQQQLSAKILCSTHIVWGTGGSMVPDAEMDKYYQKGKNLLDG